MIHLQLCTLRCPSPEPCIESGCNFTQAIIVELIKAIPQFDIGANNLKRGAFKENISLSAGSKNSVEVKLTKIVYPSRENSRISM